MDIIKLSLAASCDFFIYTRAVYPLIKHCNVRNKAHYGNNCAQSWILDAPILRQEYIKRFVQLLLLRTIVLPSFHISDLESAAHSLNRSRPSLAFFQFRGSSMSLSLSMSRCYLQNYISVCTVFDICITLPELFLVAMYRGLGNAMIVANLLSKSSRSLFIRCNASSFVELSSKRKLLPLFPLTYSV